MTVYGVQLPNGSYTGLIGHVNRNEVDLSITPLMVTPFRLQAFDFTEFLFMDQQQLLGKRPKPEADITGFIKPFPPYVSA
ncbi:hypothetical protein SK128_007355 [Halocaridina rubra]|uniref:Ionotropic glutamate receptor L-glutamate and glycine-binding domain-containing protein n=1 Tax=Halocaridina rubra TaxID=373956 RepID=A0AAN8ZPT8_HALRR